LPSTYIAEIVVRMEVKGISAS